MGTPPVNNTTQKAIDILRLLSETDERLGLSDISRKLNLPKTTVFSIVHTLEQNGMLERSTHDASFRLGPTVCSLGFSFLRRHSLMDLAKRRLLQLQQETRQTIFMAIRDGMHMVYVLKLHNASPVQLTAREGTFSPILASGLGKVALAAMTDEEIIHRVTPEVFEHSNDPEIHDLPSLLSYLEKARKRGFVMDSGSDSSVQIQSVAVPIRNAEGGVAATVSVVSLQENMSREQLKEMGHVAVQAALDISAQLGYQGGRLLTPGF